MKSNLLIPITTLVLLLKSVCGAVMPDFMKICSRNDPKIDECVKDSVHSLRPYLKSGIEDINVPPMEPLFIGDLTILEGTAGITVKVKKLNIYGASNFEIKKIRASDNAKRFDFELNLPRLEGEGSYEINGNILALPIKGQANFYAFVRIVFDIKNINDVDRISIRSMDVKIRTGKGRLKLENLFNGDKALGDVINDTINQNFELFTNEVIGPLQSALEKKFTTIASKILENFTYDELFPA